MKQLIASALLLFASIPAVGQAQLATPQTSSSDREGPPEVVIASQPDSPLTVSTSTRWTMPGREMLDLFISVKNTDSRAVSSYATRVEVNTRGIIKELCYTQNIYGPGKALQKDQKDGKSRFLGVDKDGPLPSYQVSLDYVEFSDGSIWGLDSCQSGEQLAGERAGGQATLELLRKILQEKGPEAVVKALNEERLQVDPDKNHSAKWLEAFWQAVGIIKHRVWDAYQTHGLPEIEAVLRKPYDASPLK